MNPRKNRFQIEPGSYEFGKIPPQAVEVEEIVIGMIMLEDRSALRVPFLKAEHFYSYTNQVVFKAIKTLSEDGRPHDIIGVTQQLKKTSELDLVGGAFHVSGYTQRVGSAASLEYYAQVLEESFILREIINGSNELIRYCFEANADFYHAIEKLNALQHGVLNKTTMESSCSHISTLVRPVLEEALVRKDAFENNKFTGVPSGLKDLDRVTGGWQKSDLIIVAARPSMGKTAVALLFGKNASNNLPVLFFSLEMSKNSLINRLVLSESEIWGQSFRAGKINDNDINQMIEAEKNLVTKNMFIDDKSMPTFSYIRSMAVKTKLSSGLGLIIIDYMQLADMQSDISSGRNREQEVSTFSRNLKSLAKELDVPIIALSQLNRSVETRGGAKRPTLADLRESGAIEQDADLVIFIYRPAYYKIQELEDGTPTANMGILDIAKHRNGPLEEVKFRHNYQFSKIFDWDDAVEHTEDPLQGKKNESFIMPKSEMFPDDLDTPF